MKRSIPAPAWIQQCPRPWVVVDWGCLRSIAPGQGLPGEFTAVVPDRAFLEVYESEKPPEFMGKLDRVLSHPRSYGRVLIGRYWGDIAREETSPRRVWQSALASIHVENSVLLRRRQARGRMFLPEDRWPPASDLGTDHKGAFIERMRAFAEHMKATRPELLAELVKGGPDYWRAQIAGTGDAMAGLAVNSSAKYDRPEWKSMLQEFPDRCAFARWLRLIVWYGMLQAIASDTGDKKLGNNYDDAHYVFLGAYTRHLWSLDPGMRLATLAVSGGATKVHATPETIPVYESSPGAP